MLNNNIYFIGFMGSSKTKTGKKIARKLEIDFIDSDEFIENQEMMTIDEIFKTKGESHFRKLETDFLLNNNFENTLISLGGGTPCFNNNMQIIKETGISIYLKLPIYIINERLLKKKEKRPLINSLSEEEFKTTIKTLFNKRKSIYEQADIVINAKKGYSKIKNTILEELEHYKTNQ